MRNLLKIATLGACLLPGCLTLPVAACAFHFGSFSHDAVLVTAHEDQPLWVEIPPMINATVGEDNQLDITYQLNTEHESLTANLMLEIEGSSVIDGQDTFYLDQLSGEIAIPLEVKRSGFQVLTLILSGQLDHPDGEREEFILYSRTTVLAR